MTGAVGQAFRRRPVAPWIATAAGVAIVAHDYLAERYGDAAGRAWPIGAALVLYALLARGDLAALGLRLRPAQGWKYWLKATLVLGLVAAGASAVMAGVLTSLGFELRAPRITGAELGGRLLRGCVTAPLLEEGLYRFVLCTPAAATAGAAGTVLVSGFAFGALHVLYGSAGPDNLIAGFILGWAYLRSGTIVVPILLHALGNLCVYLLQYAWSVAG